MVNETHNQKEDRVMKILAIIGFIVTIILIAWLAVQVVRLIPGAFSSLASLADNIYNRDQSSQLEVTSSHNVVNSRSAITINWAEQKESGSYSFTYSCVPGVSLDVRTNGTIAAVDCDTPYEIPDNIFTLEALFASERERFVDVGYTLTFTPDDIDKDEVVTHKTLTLINPSIPLHDDTNIADEDDNEQAPEPIVDTTPDLPYTGYDGEDTYVDLAVAFKRTGVIVGGQFVAQHPVSENDIVALQFEVVNNGTRTSDAWSFTTTMTSGTPYHSPTQEPLRPSERVIVTVSFDGVSFGLQEFTVTLVDVNDHTKSNNTLSKSVAISR